MKWILDNARTDFLFIYLPGLLAIVFAIVFSDIAASSLAYIFIAYVLVDSGHVYTTLWRTYFYKDELQSQFLLYLMIPISVCTVFIFWGFLGFQYLWTFVVYSTVFHQIRQNYGILRWYQRANKSESSKSTYFMWAFCGLPFLAYHFRENVVRGYYSSADLFSWPSKTLFSVVFVCWLIALIWWVVYEYRRFKAGNYDMSRALYLLFICLLYAFCFFHGRKAYEVLIPLLLAHGIAYFALMSRAMNKTQTNRFKNINIALIVVVVTAVVFGYSESLIETNINFNRSGSSGVSIEAFIVGVYLTPLFTHFIVDAFIWKRNHREAGIIYK